MFPVRLFAFVFGLTLGASLILPLAHADLLPPQAQDSAERLKKNPAAFDNVDTFCEGKQPGSACTLPGNTFAGGGAGLCRNELNHSTFLIDMTCQRKATVVILNPQLPAGGFVVEAKLCNSGLDFGNEFTCTPVTPPPADRFCQGKKVQDVCTVELTNDGKKEQFEGVCRQISEKQGFYFQGRRTGSREVIRCQPPQTVQHTLHRVSPLKKLLQ